MNSWLERLIGETQAKLLRLLRRSSRTITGLSDDLQLTDNAIRSHVAALGRDGLVEEAGAQRDTGGKPARLYSLTREGEELFPKAYAPVLGAVLQELHRTEGSERTVALLREVGDQIGSAAWQAEATPEERIEAAAATLRSLGADLEVQNLPDGWRLQGYACPLSALTPSHPELCELATSIVAKITGCPVTECCDRGGRARCAFEVSAA